jgi:hypothetical protein
MTDQDKNQAPNPAGAKPCPICGRPPVAEFRPFCSKRCRTVDLNRWLGGAYAIPGDPAPGEGEEPE